MTVYVDDMLAPARPEGYRGPHAPKWSHMFADSPTELAEFARRLGLAPSWLQHGGTHREHYDVTLSVRGKALAAGAVAITYPRDVADLIERRRAVCQCKTLRSCRWGDVASVEEAK